MRDWQERALKTFVQAFLGVLVPEVIIILEDIYSFTDRWKAVLVPLVCSSLAAGISAAWNIYLESRK